MSSLMIYKLFYQLKMPKKKTFTLYQISFFKVITFCYKNFNILKKHKNNINSQVAIIQLQPFQLRRDPVFSHTFPPIIF